MKCPCGRFLDFRKAPSPPATGTRIARCRTACPTFINHLNLPLVVSLFNFGLIVVSFAKGTGQKPTEAPVVTHNPLAKAALRGFRVFH